MLTSLPYPPKLFAINAKAKTSPLVVVAYPARDLTCDIDPVFACTRLAAGVPRIRLRNVPSSAAIGSVATNCSWLMGSLEMFVRTDVSALAVR